MTYTEIITRAKKICDQPIEADSGLWMDSLWLSILNNIQLRIVDNIKAIITKDASVKTTASNDYVDIPSTIITPSIVYLDGDLMQYMNPKAMGMQLTNWVIAETGRPKHYHLLNGKLYFDRPSDVVYDMVIFGTKRVTDMSVSQTTPFEGLPNLLPYDHVLLFGLVVEFCRDTGDYEKEDIYLRRFEKDKLEMEERIHSGVEQDGYTFQPTPLIYSDESEGSCE